MTIVSGLGVHSIGKWWLGIDVARVQSDLRRTGEFCGLGVFPANRL